MSTKVRGGGFQSVGIVIHESNRGITLVAQQGSHLPSYMVMVNHKMLAFAMGFKGFTNGTTVILFKKQLLIAFFADAELGC